MKISILLPDLRGGGVERVKIVLAHEFARSGHEVEFVVMQARGELLDEARASYHVVDLATPRFRAVPLALARYLRHRRPDALLAAMWPLTGIAGVANRLSGQKTRLTASEHTDFRRTPSHKGYERWLLKWFGRQLYAPCDAVVAVSHGVAGSLREVAGLRSERVTVIHNPVRPMAAEEMKVDDRQLLRHWLQGEVRLIAVGSLKSAKGFDVLLRSLARLRACVDARLLILGEGGLRSELMELAMELGIAEHVVLPGFRANPSVFLKHASVFVLSSHWEGFGNVIVEALTAGVPVVSTDCPSGPSEILDGGKYGRLVPPGDWRSMAAEIMSVLHDPPNSEDLKMRGAEFSPNLMAARYLDLLSGSHRA